jgi:hypothetical protein
LVPNKYSSSLRASSPWLEPEKELSCLGEAIPALIFTEKTVQISFVRPPTRTSQGVGLAPFIWRCLESIPTASGYAVVLGFAQSNGALAASLCLRQMVVGCGVTLRCRLASRDCNSLAPEAVGLFEPRHLAPPTSFSGLFLSAAPEAEAAFGGSC